MELETKDQININYNTFFYATMCHVCKRFGDDVSLKRCGGCWMISYCGKQHQKEHWAQHKPLCKAVRDVLKNDGLERHIFIRNNWNHTKVALMMAVEEKKGSLKFYESQMFLFLKECAICHERNAESLVDCRNCALSFCKNHKDDIAHKDACALLELCLRVNISAMNKQHNIKKLLNTFLEHISNTVTFNTFLNIKDFINSCGNIQEGHSEMSYNISTAYLSGYLTRPLTLLHAMQILNYVQKRTELIIHVVAATVVEELTVEMWEILLHFILKTEASLMIVIIGTELNNESRSLSICDNCLSQGKKISLEFYHGLYEDYVRSPSFVKPDFAVAFNANIQEENNDILTPEIEELSLQMLAEQNCPFLLTNHTQETLQKSINRINTILNSIVHPVFSGKNPFASLRPNRCVIGRELVIYSNNFLAIYRSLCS